MAFWDFIFGTKDLGWLKTALIAGLFGLIILAVFGGLSGDSENKYFYILPGLPVWWVVKSIYWSSRANQIIDLKKGISISKKSDQDLKKAELKKHIDSLIENNIPLWDRLSKEGLI